MILFGLGPHRETISVAVLATLTDLKQAETETRKMAGEQKRTWQLGPSQNAKLNGCDALVMQFTNPPRSEKGYAILATNGRDIYFLNIVSPEAYAAANEPAFQKVIQSFAVSL